ncbi:MAG: c-type cytochrome [Polyangiaceae bacterium]
MASKAGWRFAAGLALVATASACDADGCAPKFLGLAGSSAHDGGLGIDAAALAVRGDPIRGRALVERFECNRCHEGTGLATPPLEKQCVSCHKDIVRGKHKAPSDFVNARWVSRVTQLADAPSLDNAYGRLKPEWIATFVRNPHDLRPKLVLTMPRLAITDAEARDVAAYLAPRADTKADDLEDKLVLERGNAPVGRELMIAKGCGTCHAMTGATLPGAILPTDVKVPDLDTGMRLAPDLRFTRERMRPARVQEWLLRPEEIRPGTPMPNFKLTAEEARNIAKAIVADRLDPLPAAEPVEVPKPLDREVTFAEVQATVLKRTCWHCHSDPDLERGDTGPGNSGGFGFAPRGLNLAEYTGVFAGATDDKGERHSIFAPMKDGTPRIVAALLARHREERGLPPDPDADLRGMPLGLPPLPMDEIRLVATWIAQGRKR